VGGTKRGKTKKEQYTHRINSNLSGESIAREREGVLFLQTEWHSKLLFSGLHYLSATLFYKKQYNE